MTRSALGALSDRLGILPEYRDQRGVPAFASDETRIAIIGAMKIDASTESRAGEALRALESWENDRIVEPVRVVRAHEPDARAVHVSTRSLVGPGRWRAAIRSEEGEPPLARDAEGSWNDEPSFDVPIAPELPMGYYSVEIFLSAGSREIAATQRLIIVPSRCVTPADKVGQRRAFGFAANLYTIRSARNWGIGDLADLAALSEWTGSLGGDFIGVNPLHALHNRGAGVSPYSPVSRLYRNPVYLDLDSIAAELGDPEVAATLRADEFREELAALREERLVRYEQVAAVKGLVLDTLYRKFMLAERPSPIRAEYDAYVQAEGEALNRFATFMAIVHDRVARDGDAAFDWRGWDRSLQGWNEPGVSHFARERAERVDFHKWVQFLIDRQLAQTAARARGAGLGIGIYQDLAIGSDRGGADTWAYPGLFVFGASVGAPPDPYSATGQNWGLPPLDPRALREDGYRFFARVLRAGFRHSGALRIDHVMGMFRLFWIPEGMTGEQGAYVRYPANDLLGIIALESTRHGSLVVGEDLGTVGDEVGPALRNCCMLSSKVLFFEREEDGGFKPADDYPDMALASANTHDMVPLAGYESARDIKLRYSAGVLSAEEHVRELEQRNNDASELRRRLRESPLTALGPARIVGRDLRAAVHEFVCRTPSALAVFSLDDVAGETEPVNVPGLGLDRYPSWSRKMRVTLAELMHGAEARRVVPCSGRAASRASERGEADHVPNEESAGELRAGERS